MKLALETRAKQEGVREGALAVISILQEMGADENTIVEKLMEKLNVSKESALQYIAEHDAQTIVRWSGRYTARTPAAATRHNPHA